MQKLLLFIFTGCFFCSCSYAQSKNNKEKRNGIVIENTKATKFVMNFINDVPNGVYYEINPNNNMLRVFGQFSNGNFTGIWYYFRESDGGLDYTLQDFVDINNTKVKCLQKSYYPNGTIKEEGYLTFEDNPIFDGTEYGEWRYYDEAGKLKETRNFE